MKKQRRHIGTVVLPARKALADLTPPPPPPPGPIRGAVTHVGFDNFQASWPGGAQAFAGYKIRNAVDPSTGKWTAVLIPIDERNPIAVLPAGSIVLGVMGMVVYNDNAPEGVPVVSDELAEKLKAAGL